MILSWVVKINPFITWSRYWEVSKVCARVLSLAGGHRKGLSENSAEKEESRSNHHFSNLQSYEAPAG